MWATLLVAPLALQLPSSPDAPIGRRGGARGSAGERKERARVGRRPVGVNGVAPVRGGLGRAASCLLTAETAISFFRVRNVILE